MNLIGQEVRHRLYGEGRVLAQENGMVRVAFRDSGEKSFLCPQAFENHLSLCDAALQDEVTARAAALRDAARREREARRLEQQRLREDQLESAAAETARRRPAANRAATAS